MRRPNLQRQCGFTLLEVLVALSILALSYGVILQILGTSASRAAVTSDYREALIVAESRLDFAVANLSAPAVEMAGTAQDRFHWQLAYAPAPEFLIEGMPVRYTPVNITVRVSWDSGGKERTVALSTLRLSRGAQG
jgi:general secretion pathway protein I